MLRNLTIVGLVFAAIHLVGIGSAEVYDPLVGVVKANNLFIIFAAVLSVGVVAGASLLFSNAGFYNLLFAVAKIVYEAAQFAISAAFFAALILWYDLGINFWLELGGPLGGGMYIMLFGGAYSLRLYDFNYPIKDTLVQSCMLPVISFAIILISDMVL
jgi:hypothetical protein